MMVFGGLIVLMTGAVMIGLTVLLVYVFVLHGPGISARNQGSGASIVFVVYIFLASIAAFGAATAYAGRYQSRHGRSNKRAFRFGWQILLAGLAIAGLFRALFG